MEAEKILIIDDDPAMVKSTRQVLEEAGYNVYSMNTGEGVVERLKLLNPALVILDLVLPGESGFQIAREIMKYKNIPIIMMSLKKEDIDKHVAAVSGAIEYLEKPVEAEELLYHVKDVLSGKENT
jgi:DNA-binding response OmpR family regulator